MDVVVVRARRRGLHVEGDVRAVRKRRVCGHGDRLHLRLVVVHLRRRRLLVHVRLHLRRRQRRHLVHLRRRQSVAHAVQRRRLHVRLLREVGVRERVGGGFSCTPISVFWACSCCTDRCSCFVFACSLPSSRVCLSFCLFRRG